VQRKYKKIYSAFIIIYFVASTICFGNIKANRSGLDFFATNESNDIFTAGDSILNEDVCTGEMLGNNQISLLNQHNLTSYNENHRKTAAQSFLSNKIIELQYFFNFFSFVNQYALSDDTDVTQIIYFIHDKDGKKRI
jgi:hypothetical protein